MINDSINSVTGGDLITYLNGSEGTATSINQAWMDYLTREGYTTGTLNDRLYNKLTDDGFTGTLADMLTEFWNTPQINYVARLDGATQIWVLSQPISLPVGYYVNFSIIKNAGASTSKEYFISGSSLRVDVQSNGKIEEVGGDMLLDGVPVQNYITDYPTDGELHKVKYTITSEGRDVEYFAVQYGGVSERLAGVILDFEVYDNNDNLIHQIPLTNKAQGATQLATVGNVNATMINYTEAVWEEI